MIRAADISELRTAAEDYQATERLKDGLQLLRKQRNPFFLTKSELNPIFKWKLRGQLGRSENRREVNPERAYEVITRAAFSINEDDWKLEAELRVGILTVLHGIGVPVASAILALVDPAKYCVIDFRGWRALFGEKRNSFDVQSYIRYLSAIRELAQAVGWSVQETDLAVWEYDRRSMAPPPQT